MINILFVKGCFEKEQYLERYRFIILLEVYPALYSTMVQTVHRRGVIVLMEDS